MSLGNYKELNAAKTAIIVTTLFIALCGFSSIDLSWSGWGSRQSFYIGVFLFIYVLFNIKNIDKGEMTNVAGWTLMSAFLSIIPAFIDWNATFRSFFYTFVATYYGLFFYYLLRIWKVSPQDIIRLVCIFCLVWVVLEIGQQFTYPQYWFLGRRNEWDNVENRVGLWRFCILCRKIF